MDIVRTRSGWRRRRITDCGALWIALCAILGIADIAIPFLMLM